MNNVIIAIGTNTNQQRNMEHARQVLRGLLRDARFTPAIWTAPYPASPAPTESHVCYGSVASHPSPAPYLNALAFGHTALSLPRLQAKLKQLEESLGDPRGAHDDGTVNIDLDLLQYCDQRLRPNDWQRPYIQQLMAAEKA